MVWIGDQYYPPAVCVCVRACVPAYVRECVFVWKEGA